MEYFLIFGIGQGVLLSFILFYKSAVRKNHAWLIGVFVLLISGIISGSILNDRLGEPEGSFLVDPLILLIGPTFYLYIRSFSSQLRGRDLLLHSLVFLLYLPVLGIFYTREVANINAPLSLQAVYRSNFAITIGILKFLHLFIYVYLSFSALHTHEAKIKRVFADLQGKDLAWLRYLLVAFVFLVVVSLVLYVIALRYPEYEDPLTLLNLSLLCVFILTISFYAYHQHTLFDQASQSARAPQLQAVVAAPKGPRYEKSGLKSEEVARIQDRIQAFIDDKGYRNPEVSLASLSKEISVSPHKISEVLGKHLNTSFYDLINRHRIEDIKEAIRDPDLSHLTILSIAYDYGYNSKSTFNAAFKKFTGRTPSEFKSLNS